MKLNVILFDYEFNLFFFFVGNFVCMEVKGLIIVGIFVFGDCGFDFFVGIVDSWGYVFF